MYIKLTLLLCVLTIGALTVQATQPPGPGELDRLRADGTLAKRIAAGKARGNHRVRPDVATRTLQRLQNMTSDRKVNAPLPDWQGMPTTGTNEMLIFLIEFPDYAATVSKATIEDKVFGDGDAGEFPTESLTQFYQRSSYNQLHLQGNVLGWYTMAHNRNWYTTEYGEGNDANREIIKEVVDAYDATHDYSQYDNNDDGKIDYFAVIWTGPDNGWNGFWWGYQWSLLTALSRDGVTFEDFSWQWESKPVGGGFDPSVIIHETGHVLGLPDYYDYNTSIGPDGGVGNLDMMDSTQGDHNSFSKFMLEWLTPTFVSSGSQHLTLRAASQYPDAAIAMHNYTNGSAYGEYFLVENRHRTLNDTGMPSDGMLIWHVDATPDASGQDFAFDNSYTAHKLLRLMEADGLEEIETGNGNGDAGDYYNQGDLFTPISMPGSIRYDGSHSSVYITNFSANGTSMTVDVSIDLTAQPPTIGHNPEQLLAWIGETESGSNQAIEVWINASSNVAYTIADDVAWLDVLPTGGASDGAPNVHAISYSTTSLTVGLYSAEITITCPAAVNSPAIIPVTVQIYGTNLAKAVDAPEMPWRTGGDATWIYQTASVHDGEDAAQNGDIGDDQVSWIETEVQNPGSLSFWWRASCEDGWDFLRYYVDGALQGASISGNVDWQRAVATVQGVGTHTIRWQYEKDSSESAGFDSVWLDEVVWTPNTTDTDGDGLYDWQEEVAGTSATNADSSLRIDSMMPGPANDSLVLVWPSTSGRVYSVSMATNIDTSFSYLATNLPADVPLNTHTVQTAAATTAYYRVSVNRTQVPDITLLEESFDTTSTPSGWSVVDNVGSGAEWVFNNPGALTNETGGSGNFAVADSDAAGEIQMDTDLVFPAQDCTGMESVWLEFKSSVYVLDDTLAEVRVRADGGPWNILWQRSETYDPGPVTYSLDLSAYAAGLPMVEIVFHYEAFWDWEWQVDDVRVYGQPVH